ncbi:MAG: hypothetical protein CM15mP74_02660 [Halieaceae bacterium]|nr:MAG: hypothetical protein CM15mP74_02660 [Halieaceae bacterium]
MEEVPLAIDELPAVLIAAACAEGVTVLSGAEELRVKESDRIASMAEGLSQLGIYNTVQPDGIEVRGGEISGGVIATHHDHRIAMSFSMAALRATDRIKISDCSHVATSFPGSLPWQAVLGCSWKWPTTDPAANCEETMKTVPVICVDGPSGVGKGTLSLQLADSLGWHLLDSGRFTVCWAWPVAVCGPIGRCPCSGYRGALLMSGFSLVATVSESGWATVM